jgi:hypothetical protein
VLYKPKKELQMIEIIRIYLNKGGATDVCIKDPNTIYETLKVLETDIDLDYLDKGKVKMGSSSEFIGSLVKVGDQELEIIEH